jgi:hypothetical protein
MENSPERCYSVLEIASAWALSAHTITRLFENEPGVLSLGNRLSARKRRYITLRIPASVMERVRTRLEVKRVM